jgi:hypothetical protein
MRAGYNANSRVGMFYDDVALSKMTSRSRITATIVIHVLVQYISRIEEGERNIAWFSHRDIDAILQGKVHVPYMLQSNDAKNHYSCMI